MTATMLRTLHKTLATLLTLCLCFTPVTPAAAGVAPPHYKVLPAIVRGNLAIFPVVAEAHDASQFLTLDEGVRTGQVTVTEAGSDPGMVRPGQHAPRRHDGAEVNRLVLTNSSARPLLLLAGEIVTGGKQDRVIGADRIVPPHTGPIDLGVFCVEPGRWVESSSKFGSMGAQMAQPSVRTPAMAERDQQSVWDNVRASNAKVSAGLSRSESAGMVSSSSYAKTFDSAPVKKRVAEYGGADSEQAILAELKRAGAVGVVVAINGRVQWADVFASNELLARYWSKLMRSYVAEAMTTDGRSAAPAVAEAERYMNQLDGGREVAETEPGVYRRTEIAGDGYKVFELTSLMSKLPFAVHITKMEGGTVREGKNTRREPVGIMVRRAVE